LHPPEVLPLNALCQKALFRLGKEMVIPASYAAVNTDPVSSGVMLCMDRDRNRETLMILLQVVVKFVFARD